MDHLASICAAFPPDHAAAADPDDVAYHKAVEDQLTKLAKLLKEPAQPLRVHGLELLQLLDPSLHSLSYLAVLHALLIPFSGLGASPAVQEKLMTFMLTFDARQLRYAGPHLLDLLNGIGRDQWLPPSVGVELLAQAVLRIDPTGSILTSTHILLVNLAYSSGHIEAALPVIDKSIVFYPGMANHHTPDVLCHQGLPPPAYISKNSGLTTALKAPAVLEYDLLCGLIYCSRRDWRKALAAFERVVTYPTRDQGISKIMVDAYKKWVLVSLLCNGKLEEVPPYTGSVASKAYSVIAKPYKDIAALFETESAAELKAEVEKNGGTEWQEDANTGLVQEVLSAYQRWQIIGLRQIYSKVSIPEIRQQTKSAQTGSILNKDEDVETLVQNMIISGALSGVIEKNDDGVSYLTFLTPAADLSEADYARELAATAVKLKELQPIFKATNERLGTSKEYIKHYMKEQRRSADKDGGDITMGFDNVDEEDLMGDISAAEVSR